MMKMKYTLIHKPNQNSKSLKTNGLVSLLAFVKHASCAGFNPRTKPSFRTTLRFLENFHTFFYSFVDKKFSIIPSLAFDPTEKGQFSNRIGRAFADYFAKKLYGARFTYCYECYAKNVGVSTKGVHPDFYCDSLNGSFVIESKGYSHKTFSDKQMQNVKRQASSVLNKHNLKFSIASVTYNIYDSPIIKYYDPKFEPNDTDETLNLKLRTSYFEFFKGLMGHLRTQSPFKLNDEYIAATLGVYGDIEFKLLVNKNILSENHKYSWLEKVDTIDEENYYIDRDGIGLYFDFSKIKLDPLRYPCLCPMLLQSNFYESKNG